jgi:membrane-bound lytic murein transglycosylase D
MYLKVIISTFISLLFLSCASITKHYNFNNNPNYSFISKEHADSIATLIKVEESLEMPSLSIDEKIALAETLCINAQYKEADTILREVLSTIDYQSEVETEWFPSESYLEAVFKVYEDKMPQEFIPEDIAMLLFKNQMLTIDSLNLTAEDSTIILSMLTRRGVSFDVPVVWNERVKKALNYYIHWKPEAINRWLTRASFYLPLMKKMFSDSGLPQDLAYLPLIESGFNSTAYSRAHASGLWQFISSTGKIYGLRHNYWIDERRDPLKATNAAIRYLRKLNNQFGHWHLALAAYNCGEGGLSRAITKNSGNNDYWSLPIPKETKNYVPFYLAAITIAKNPDLFNFSFENKDTFNYDTVTISSCVQMKDIADGITLDYELFRKTNPQILRWCTPPDMSNVVLYLPKGYSLAFYDFYNQLPEEKKIKFYTYKVRKGEKIHSIARRFKVSPEAIKEINHLKSTRITAGKLITIPIPSNSSVPIETDLYADEINQNSTASQKLSGNKKVKYKVKKGDTISEIAEMFDVSIGEISDWNDIDGTKIKCDQILTIYSKGYQINSQSEKPAQSLKSGVKGKKYTVKSGDTPYSIARNNNISLNQLISINELDKNNPVIYPGESLIVSLETSNISSNVSQNRASATGTYINYMVSPGDNLFQISQNFSIPLDELRRINNMENNDIIKVGDIIQIPRKSGQSKSAATREIVFYKVKQGDNLWSIASAFGVTVEKLYQANNLNSDSVIMPGDTLKVVKTEGM